MPRGGDEWTFTGRGDGRSSKHRVAGLAARQSGLVARRQLIALGVSDTEIVGWLGAGYLFRRVPGVYAVGHAAPSLTAELTAALLWAGPGAMLSHGTAAWWLGLLDRRPASIELSTPRRPRSRRGLTVHGRRDTVRVWHRDLPTTPVVQTLLDLAAHGLAHDRLRRALAEAEYHDWLDLDLVRALLARGPRGSVRLRAAMEAHEPRLAHTRSELERRMLALCQRAGLPLPECNVTVEGLLVDAVWRAERVVVEVDGRDGHRTWAQTVRDRGRDLTLRRARFAVLRYVWDQVVGAPAAVEADLADALGHSQAA